MHSLSILALCNLQAQCDVSIPVLVITLEDIRHPLQANASLHEQVETQALFSGTLVATSTSSLRIRVEQQLHELGAQAVSKRYQRIRKLLQADVAAPVRVKAVEKSTPCRKESPQAAELVKVDSTAAVCVEHADHHLHSMRVEGCVVAIDEGATELMF